jgi:hypothetical protein
MKRTIALLVAATALTATIGVPAWSSMRLPAAADHEIPAGERATGSQGDLPLTRISDDDDDDRGFFVSSRWLRWGDDDDDHGRRSRSSGRYADDDHGRRHGHDDDDDDDDCYGRNCGASNPAPAGSVAPPANGLFGNGAAPQVQVN